LRASILATYKQPPFSWAVADELRYTILDHRDPADRILVATAKVFNLTLVTADERLMRPDSGSKRTCQPLTQ
jgi:PIN domain nuclease of toxin-antitoxin system